MMFLKYLQYYTTGICTVMNTVYPALGQSPTLSCRTPLHYRVGRSCIMLQLCPALPCGSVLHYLDVHSVIMLTAAPPLCSRTLRYYRIALSDISGRIPEAFCSADPIRWPVNTRSVFRCAAPLRRVFLFRLQ